MKKLKKRPKMKPKKKPKMPKILQKMPRRRQKTLGIILPVATARELSSYGRWVLLGRYAPGPSTDCSM